MNGWIKLHRQIQDCWIWFDEPFTKAQAWIDLLLLANHKEKKISINGKPVVIQRGQYHTSVCKLASRWKWNRKTVSRFLDVLENDHMLSQVRTSTGTTITIENYDVFQDEGTTVGTTVRTAQGTAVGTQTRKKEEKKERIIKSKTTFQSMDMKQEYDFDEMEKQLLG